ncbi:hypothetical protein G6F65_018896 [Rhizopus arrhizus]|nr:hypothetical protein G6F65_018896 [Rhizopus arrhizus]
MNAVASKPADPAARQDLLGKANSLATQIRSAYTEMQNQREGLNTQITATVEQVNSYLTRIDDLNTQISLATGKAGNGPPNDLLDQRDLAVAELNQLVGITTYEQGDKINISLAKGGQALLSGTTIYPLQAVPSTKDAGRTVLAYTLPAGSGKTVSVELSDNEVTGGKLGGLPAEVVVAADQQKADTGRQAVERLLKRDRVDIMTGIVFSNVLLPVMPAILQSGTIYLSTNTGPENYAGAGLRRRPGL